MWRAAEALQDERTALVRLLVLCPLRRSEAANLTAGEIDLDRAEIRLTASRTKNKAHFVMPLSGAAVALLGGGVAGGLGPSDRLFAR